jgi:hypothetical protein
LLQRDGTWSRLPRNERGFRQKVFWWRPRYNGRVEPSPQLTVRGRRLHEDGSFVAGRATNAHSDDLGWAMLTVVDVPSAGCWELTGQYADGELTFVVYVAGD